MLYNFNMDIERKRILRDKNINIRLRSLVFEEIENAAYEEGITKSEYLIQCHKEHLARKKECKV